MAEGKGSKTKTGRRSRAGGHRPDWGPDFLDAFAEELTITAACEKVGIGRQTFYNRLDRDPTFATAFHEADEKITDTMERELHRRAVEGVERPVFQGGQEVGKIREFSDRLLELGLRARRRDKYSSKIEVSDTREERERREVERMSDSELQRDLTGADLDDNVVDLDEHRKAS